MTGTLRVNVLVYVATSFVNEDGYNISLDNQDIIFHIGIAIVYDNL